MVPTGSCSPADNAFLGERGVEVWPHRRRRPLCSGTFSSCAKKTLPGTKGEEWEEQKKGISLPSDVRTAAVDDDVDEQMRAFHFGKFHLFSFNCGGGDGNCIAACAGKGHFSPQPSPPLSKSATDTRLERERIPFPFLSSTLAV
jgi:hypothetical protein